MSHAPLAPSSAARIVACPGSVAMEARHPDEETDETREGDAAHWALAEMLLGREVDVGQVANNGVTLNLEMIEGAAMLGDHIKARGSAGEVEQTIVNDYFHAENWGTPDHVGYAPLKLFVDDFKYGHGFIPAVGNWQLLNYAGLRLAELAKSYGENVWELTVVMTIGQPRCYRRGGFIRSWEVPARELKPYFETLRKQYDVAMQPNAPCIPNPECEGCKARFDCEAALSEAQYGMDVAYDPVPLHMSPDAKAVTLKRLTRAAERINAVLTGLDADIKASIMRGVRVPGYLIESGAGSTVWTVSKEEVRTLGDMMGVSLSKDEAVTPIQAVSAFKRAKLDPEIIAAYSTVTAGKAKLIESSASMAAKAFNQE